VKITMIDEWLWQSDLSLTKFLWKDARGGTWLYRSGFRIRLWE